MNAELAYRVIQELVRCGVREVCCCAGSRNAPLCMTLMSMPQIKVYNWPEERSAAYFALGRSRQTGLPVPVVVTSGAAAGELLPATMEAYYSGIPLILVTADRPRNYRGTGAPQSADQVGLFGQYAPFAVDVEGNEPCDLSRWNQRGPAHVNVCFEEPQWQPLVVENPTLDLCRTYSRTFLNATPKQYTQLNQFLGGVQRPLVIVSTLKPQAKPAVKRFLLKLGAPVFLEAISGLREDPDLQHLAVHFPDKVAPRAQECGYPIDGVLRIGGVPTFRFWRDLELIQTLPVLSVDDTPFTGLTMGKIITADLDQFFEGFDPLKTFTRPTAWLEREQEMLEGLFEGCEEEPLAETAMIRSLSKQIPEGAHVYLGNSLPIREWDLAATMEERGYNMQASRGMNGIDGQISTFLGLSDVNVENWGFFGDLTTIYDLAAPWVLPQLKKHRITIVVVNNSGGMIFQKMFSQPELQNRHSLSFEGFALQWGLTYERWTKIPEVQPCQNPRLIELIPDEVQTARFNASVLQRKRTRPVPL